MCLCLLYHLWQFFILMKKLWHKSGGMTSDGQESKWLKTSISKKSYVVFDPFQPIQCKQKSEPNSELNDYIYNTFRIPAIVSHKSSVFAFCEGRRDTHEDFGHIDIVLRRGEMKNGNLEWNDEGLIIVAESSESYRCMNPCPTVDHDGNIIVVYAKFPMDKTESDLIIGSGFEERVCCSKSKDNGETWNLVCDMTDVVKSWDPEPLVYAPGPGHSLEMKDGSIVVSGNIQYKKKLPNWTKISCVRKILNRCAPFYGAVGRACFIYSDNGGLEWKRGKIVEPATYGCRKRPLHGNESQAAEIRPGEVYINSRTREPTRNRQSAVTHKNRPSPDDDVEETKLYEPSGIPRILSHLIPEFLQSGGCEGSVLGIYNSGLIKYLDDNKVLLVFSNPASKRKRENLSVRVSIDCGRTWSGPISLHHGPSAYSDLVHISPDDGDGHRILGCMYESSRSVKMETPRKTVAGNGKKDDYEASCIVLDVFDAGELLTKCRFEEENDPVDETLLVAKPV